MSNSGEKGRGKHAIITGGSSGIGLAAARYLAQRGMSISLVARDLDRLKTARALVEQSARESAKVAIFTADVGDADALATALKESVIFAGPPSWAIACAGITRPGSFLELPLEVHEVQVRTNYFGTLNLTHILAPIMVKAGGGRMIFVASGAALAGIYGYSPYAPSKFAVRGLAEILRIELSVHKVSITVVYPPDTNTPQLAAEIPLRSKASEIISSLGGVWEPEDVARAMITGAERGRFTITPGWGLSLLNCFHSIIAPAFRAYQARVVRRYGSSE